MVCATCPSNLKPNIVGLQVVIHDCVIVCITNFSCPYWSNQSHELQTPHLNVCMMSLVFVDNDGETTPA